MIMQLSTRARALLEHETPPTASPQEPMVRAATDAVLDALDRGETHYTDRPGILPLRKKVASLLAARFATVFEPGQLTITCGVTEARFVAIQQLLKEKDTIAAPVKKDRIAGAVIIRGGMIENNDLSRASLLYAPTSASPDVIKSWLAAIPDECFVIYEADAPGETFHPAQVEGFANRVVTIGELGLDKGLASARLGYIAAPSGEAAGLRDFKQALTICSTNLSQWAALAAVEAL